MWYVNNSIISVSIFLQSSKISFCLRNVGWFDLCWPKLLRDCNFWTYNGVTAICYRKYGMNLDKLRYAKLFISGPKYCGMFHLNFKLGLTQALKGGSTLGAHSTLHIVHQNTTCIFIEATDDMV